MQDSKNPIDPEKGIGDADVHVVPSSSATSSNDVLPVHVPEKLSKWNQAIQSLKGLEARGISRVPSNERDAPTTAALIQMAIVWYSANIAINNLVIGMLGPLLFGLG
ncbi:MAG: hypothetical protein Q9169_007816, partial [Polycauliona sp. 2 TL-2023]